jgi:hypothetical protein
LCGQGMWLGWLRWLVWLLPNRDELPVGHL